VETGEIGDEDVGGGEDYIERGGDARPAGNGKEVSKPCWAAAGLWQGLNV
jgi:hypothetical protein